MSPCTFIYDERIRWTTLMHDLVRRWNVPQRSSLYALLHASRAMDYQGDDTLLMGVLSLPPPQKRNDYDVL